MSLSQSPSVRRPLLIFSPSSSQTLLIRRFTSWRLLISSEKIATGVFTFTAMFFAIDRTNAVLPIAGRAAMIIRSEFCQPDVSLSSSWNCVSNPESPVSRFAAASICSMACLITGSICVTSFFTLRCEISNNFPSASWRRSSTSLLSSKALPSIADAKLISSRARYFCATIRAWNSTWAPDATFAVRPEIYTGPPTSSSAPLARSRSVTVSMSIGCCDAPSCCMAA